MSDHNTLPLPHDENQLISVRREKMQGLGLEPRSSAPEEFGQMIETDVARYGQVIRRLGLKAD